MKKKSQQRENAVKYLKSSNIYAYVIIDIII